MGKYFLGIDLGGTNLKVGIVNKDGEILYKKQQKTNLPKSMQEIEEDIYLLSKNLCIENKIDINKEIISVGLGTPGSVNNTQGIVALNANFGFENWKVKESLEKLFNLRVFIENDAKTAIIAESLAGNAKGCENAIALTLGTGVGGGILINSKVYGGVNFSGGEVGHMVIEIDGRQCNCGRKGCFEKYAAASALTQDTKNAMQENKDSLLWTLSPNIDDVNAKTCFDAAKKGDSTAMKLIDDYIHYLSCGITNLINIFQPEVICIGGGVSNEEEILLQRIQVKIDAEDFARNINTRTIIKRAKFRNDAGIIGAALLGVKYNA